MQRKLNVAVEHECCKGADLNQALKQRLVGTLVLGCLAIIFIPLLLDGDGLPPVVVIENTIPPAPDLAYADLPEPERPVIEADSLPAEALPADDEAVAIAEANAAAPAGPATPAADTAASAPAATVPAESAAIPLPVPADRVDAAASVADSTPTRGADGLPDSWTVRLGAFGNLANADKLRACLIASGYQAYSRQQPGDNGSMTRVFVGPVATRAEATALVSKLKGSCELQESGMPVPYTQQ